MIGFGGVCCEGLRGRQRRCWRGDVVVEGGLV